MTEPGHSALRSPLFRHVPPGQAFRYLLVGAWNTLFGYATYAGFTAILATHLRHGYVLASLFSSLLNITVAFLGYKWFVFKTKGNYLHEWMRCVGVYSGSMIIGLILLPVLVYLIRRYTVYHIGAPYIAGALLTGISVVMSFFGHKYFSFRKS